MEVLGMNLELDDVTSFFGAGSYNPEENTHHVKSEGWFASAFKLDRIGIKSFSDLKDAIMNKDSEAAKRVDKAVAYALKTDNREMLSGLDSAANFLVRAGTIMGSSILMKLPIIGDLIGYVGGITGVTLGPSIVREQFGENWYLKAGVFGGTNSDTVLKEIDDTADVKDNSPKDAQPDKAAMKTDAKPAAGAQPAAKPASVVTVTPLAKKEPITIIASSDKTDYLSQPQIELYNPTTMIGGLSAPFTGAVRPNDPALNPMEPTGLFNEAVAWASKFVGIGNANASTYKEVPLSQPSN